MSSASKVKLKSFDDLFGNNDDSQNKDQIIDANLTDLHTFKDHPFKVLDDEKMEETTESIRQHGVLVPGIVRPRAAGGYEIIAGHRRKRGSERAGKDTMPVIVRNYTDDEATIIMVDSNIQRENILPSEKAKAYAMKYEAVKHQGKKGVSNSLDEVGEAAGDNAKTVQRYIWLSRLSSDLMELVDLDKIPFMAGVELSFLPSDEQKWLFDMYSDLCLEEKNGNYIKISLAQAAEIRKASKEDILTSSLIQDILKPEKKEKVRSFKFKKNRISEYFPETVSDEEIEETIYKLLDAWRKKQL